MAKAWDGQPYLMPLNEWFFFSIGMVRGAAAQGEFSDLWDMGLRKKSRFRHATVFNDYKQA